ncbi:MAG: YceI family protein [Methylococcales bacterium]
MKALQIKQILLALVLSTTALSATADWTLNNADSSLNFIAIKKLSIGEVHAFNSINGSLKDNGDAKVNVILSSVNTQIPKRDARMKKKLFEITKFPQASVTTKLDIHRINNLKVGESFSQTVELALSIHGQQQEVEANMRVTALANNRLLASTIKPIIINAKDFKLVKGINILRSLAKLSSISTAIPVTADFIFEK